MRGTGVVVVVGYEEREGLDFSEHGGSCYPDFVTTGGRSFAGVTSTATEQYEPAPSPAEKTAEAEA